MNPLPLISLWLCEHGIHPISERHDNYNWNPTREELRSWITTPSLNGNTLTIAEVYEISDVDLAIDCLIAVGIGCYDIETFNEVSCIAKRPKRFCVIRCKQSGKYADGYYGWDGSVHSLEQVFAEDELPYHPSDDLEFIFVWHGPEPPTLDQVAEFFNRV
jgi:hypothetical protein